MESCRLRVSRFPSILPPPPSNGRTMVTWEFVSLCVCIYRVKLTTCHRDRKQARTWLLFATLMIMTVLCADAWLVCWWFVCGFLLVKLKYVLLNGIRFCSGIEDDVICAYISHAYLKKMWTFIFFASESISGIVLWD